MAKQTHPTVLTANDLVEGHSVFLTAEGWSPDIKHALIAVNADQADELSALGARYVRDNEIVGPYLVDVALNTGVAVPISRREQIRAAGTPTIPVGVAA